VVLQELEWLETLNCLRLEGRVIKDRVSLAEIGPKQGLGLGQIESGRYMQALISIF